MKSVFVLAQADNSSLFEPLGLSVGKAGELYLRFTNLNFVRNNEYFSPIVRGQTFFGYQIAPSLLYLPTERISIEAGVFLRHDFGRQDYAQILPIFSFRYKKDSTSLTLGALEGNLQHRLIEPLYAFERVLTNHLENGLQIRHKSRQVSLDVWVDWQQNTYPRADRQEHIWAGIHLAYKIPIKSQFLEEKYRLELVLQATDFHQGGQNLNLPTTVPTTNSLQIAVGTRLKGQKWRAEAYYIRTAQNAYTDTLLYKRSGNGFYAQIGRQVGKFDLVLSYWQGYGVDNGLGGDLYKSFPTHPKGWTQMHRYLLLLRLSRTWQLADNIFLTARFEPYYDFVNGKLEHADMLFVTFRPAFRLGKF